MTTIIQHFQNLTLNIIQEPEKKKKCNRCHRTLVISRFIGRKGKEIQSCDECTGKLYCDHGNQKHHCKECKEEGKGGINICIHNKQSAHCKECSPLSHLGAIVYRRIHQVVGPKWAKNWRELLGCTIEEYKNYLESKWEPWMNWDNYGPPGTGYDVWNIDHIVPFNCGNPTIADKLQRCHYTNTRPLRTIDNNIKSDNL